MAKIIKEIKNLITVVAPSGEYPGETSGGAFYVLSGLHFNYLEDIPLDLEFYNFEANTMLSKPLVLKNMYDQYWNVDTTINDGVSGVIENMRYYVDVNADSDNTVYNVYKLGRDYSSDNYYPSSSLSTSSLSNSGEISDTLHMIRDSYVDNFDFDNWTSLSALSEWTTSATAGSGFLQKDLVLGKPWIYSISGYTTQLEQSDVFSDFSTGDLYSIDCYVDELTNGSLILRQDTTNHIMTITNRGDNHIVFSPIPSVNSTSGTLYIQTSGFTDVILGSIDVRPIDLIDEYQHIERIDGQFNYGDVPLHKSNVFSIKIDNSNLNDNYTATDKDNIQLSINNIIRQVIDKITPVHTQLFDIYWTGD